MSENKTQPINEATINAIVDALGAVVFATVRQLPPEGKAAFANDLYRLASRERANGDTPTAALLADLHRAATSAAS